MVFFQIWLGHHVFVYGTIYISKNSYKNIRLDKRDTSSTHKLQVELTLVQNWFFETQHYVLSKSLVNDNNYGKTLALLALLKCHGWKYCSLICYNRKTLFVRWNSMTLRQANRATILNPRNYLESKELSTMAIWWSCRWCSNCM